MKVMWVLAIALVALPMCSCDDGPTAPLGPARVDGMPWDNVIGVGDSFKLVVVTSDGRALKTNWRSLNPTVVSVDADGVVTGLRLGSAWIKGENELINWGTEITVARRVARLLTAADSMLVVPGAIFWLQVAAEDSGGTRLYEPRAFRWTSSDTSIVGIGPITNPSHLTARTEGTATVSVSTESGVTASVRVEVGLVDLVSVVRGRCGLSTDSLAYCWGTSKDPGPGLPVSFTDRFLSLSKGGGHACGIRADTQAVCWGAAKWGALGLGGRYQPTVKFAVGPMLQVSGAQRFVSVAAGLGIGYGGAAHTCGIDELGDVYCWGVGDGAEVCDHMGWDPGVPIHCSRVPIRVEGLPQMSSISAGGVRTCGISTDGETYCWPLDHVGHAHVAVTGSAQLGFHSVSAGGDHTCAISSSATVYCWGNNDHGQLGNGSIQRVSDPEPVLGSEVFATVSAGTQHTCALRDDGVVFCWGQNNYSQCGVSGESEILEPTPIESPLLFTSVSAGLYDTCGIATDDLAYCWGNYRGGATGSPVPTALARQR